MRAVRRPPARDTSRLLPPAATNRHLRHGARTPRHRNTVAHLQGTRRRPVAENTEVFVRRPPSVPFAPPGGCCPPAPPGPRSVLRRHKTAPPDLRATPASSRCPLRAEARGRFGDPLACAGLTTSVVLSASPGEPKPARCRWREPPFPRATPSHRHRPLPPKWLRLGCRLVSASIWTSTAGPVAGSRAEALAPCVPSRRGAFEQLTTPGFDRRRAEAWQWLHQELRVGLATVADAARDLPTRGRPTARTVRHALGRLRALPHRQRLAETRSCRSERRPRPVRATRDRLPTFPAGARGLRRVQSGGPIPGLPLRPFHLRGAPQPRPLRTAGFWTGADPGAVARRQVETCGCCSAPVASHRPRSVSCSEIGSSSAWPSAGPKPFRQSEKKRMRHVWRVARLQGLTLLESPLPPVGGLDRPGGPMLSWVFNLSRVFPSVASNRCFHQSSSLRLGRARASRRKSAPCVSTSEELLPAASQSLREQRSWPASHENRHTLIRFLASSSHAAIRKSEGPWLMVSPRVPGCIAVP